MAYSTVVYHSVPAVYTYLPKQQMRRTATNIMAGCFDPLPMPPSAFAGDSSTSRATSVSVVEQDEQAHVGTRRPAGMKKGRVTMTKKGLRVPPVARVPEGSNGKGRVVKRVLPEEKENNGTMSDGESSESLSPPPPSPTRVEPTPGDVHTLKPQASGFWRARSSNTSEASSLKRKRSSARLDDKEDSAPEDTRESKRPRLSEPAVLDVHSCIFYSTSPSLGSSGSLSSAVSEPMEVQELEAQCHSEKSGKVIASHFSEDRSGFRCNLCSKTVPSMPHLEAHFQDRHKEMSDQKQPTPQASPPKRIRGPRKNVAVKKGWKGWVEEDLEPQKLILLDKPEVLPERTTRSGRKID